MKTARKPKDELSIKHRWNDVIPWKCFWQELEESILKMQNEAWFSGYRSGKREERSKLTGRK